MNADISVNEQYIHTFISSTIYACCLVTSFSCIYTVYIHHSQKLPPKKQIAATNSTPLMDTIQALIKEPLVIVGRILEEEIINHGFNATSVKKTEERVKELYQTHFENNWHQVSVQ